MEALRKRSHHTQQQGSDSVDFGGEDEAVTKAATTEVKRLETKVCMYCCSSIQHFQSCTTEHKNKHAKST